jgi:hypothetical protein
VSHCESNRRTASKERNTNTIQIEFGYPISNGPISNGPISNGPISNRPIANQPTATRSSSVGTLMVSVCLEL